MDNPAAPAAPAYAGFWLRALAHLLDSLGLLLLMLLLLMGAVLFANWQPAKLLGPGAQLLQSLVLAVLTVWLWRRYAATPGKLALGLRIVDAQSGGPASTRQLCIRYCAYLPALLPLGLGLFWVGFDPRKQGWHDKLAGTLVLRPAIKP